jgi:hypothetical protein
MAIVGELILRNVNGKPSIQNMGELNKCISIYSDTEHVLLDNEVYNVSFNKKKSRIILSNSYTSDNLHDKAKEFSENVINEMNMRIDDINHLEKKIQVCSKNLCNPSSVKYIQGELIKEISMMVDIVQNHKQELLEHHKKDFRGDIKYTKTKTTTRISMMHGMRYAIDEYLVTWFHYTGDIKLDDVSINYQETAKTDNVRARIEYYMTNHIADIVYE